LPKTIKEDKVPRCPRCHCEMGNRLLVKFNEPQKAEVTLDAITSMPPTFKLHWYAISEQSSDINYTNVGYYCSKCGCKLFELPKVSDDSDEEQVTKFLATGEYPEDGIAAPKKMGDPNAPTNASGP